jgi:hypothetical protein
MAKITDMLPACPLKGGRVQESVEAGLYRHGYGFKAV